VRLVEPTPYVVCPCALVIASRLRTDVLLAMFA
jgi:hypothetical protein